MTSDRIICSLALTASMMCGAAEPFRIAKDVMPQIVVQEGLRPFVAKAALAFGEQRDRLDKRYASGKWKHWYDRDLIYPCHSVTEKLSKALER